ncbi:MAG: GspE/PulE family protein [Oceanococcus sp.]
MSYFTGIIDTAWLCDELQTQGWLSAQQSDDAKRRLVGTRSQSHPITRLAQLKLLRHDKPQFALDTEALCRWLARRCGMPYLKIDPLNVDISNVTALCPYAYASRAGILPVGMTKTTARFAVSQPGLLDWLPDIEQISGRKIERVIANPEDIKRYAVEFYALARSISASEKEQKSANERRQNLEQLTELGKRGNLDADDQHIVGVVDWVLQYAFDQRASDIHLEPRRDTGNIRFRIDGVLHQVYQMPAKVMAAVNARLKILGRLDLAEKRRPQDGRIKTRSPDGQEIELRLSTMPTAFGEKLVLRVFDPDSLLKDYAGLGLNEQQTSSWQTLTDQPHGIVLVTGPTGSGKTTTLYSTLRQLADDTVNICTIEDPIELVEPQFNQLQVNAALGVTFAQGVRTVLRQDPDIIMVGEIRDLETAEVAIQAALTGHLVLSTLHTNDAAAALTRLLDLGVPAYLLRATLLGVLAQRLTRRLCPHCREPAPVDSAEWSALAGLDTPEPAHLTHAPGCLECRATGYLGRLGLYQLLEISPKFRQLIDENTDLETLRTAARAEGCVSLRDAGLELVRRGETNAREILRVTPTG